MSGSKDNNQSRSSSSSTSKTDWDPLLAHSSAIGILKPGVVFNVFNTNATSSSSSSSAAAGSSSSMLPHPYFRSQICIFPAGSYSLLPLPTLQKTLCLFKNPKLGSYNLPPIRDRRNNTINKTTLKHIANRQVYNTIDIKLDPPSYTRSVN
ncbi:hypothetical protein GE09DRAFT_1059281 [Coniochaeta sp. 2T2.1]|nr:hypothetical protein GE09DRAFT_1059281 [Coniochaeta sp. 2T2.1]